MGKFFEALKRLEDVNRQATPLPAVRKVAKISPENVDALKLDPRAPKAPEEQPTFPRNGFEPGLASFLEPHSVALESFKMLRAKLFTNNSGRRPRSIMVTSPQPLDGKTIVAVNLAISIAQRINEHVVLVDCDFRCPSLDRILGLNANEGIREYLEEGTSVAPYFVKTPVEKLTLLPSGKPPPNPSELLSSEKMRHLAQELKKRYDDRYVIFDATPAQFASETSFLASIADTVLMVVRAGQTKKELLLQAIENVGRDNIFGIIFNGSRETLGSYKDYHHYYGSRSKKA